MGYYLMIKEAVGLNLKYLCKCGDYKDHIAYRGSGKLWRRIINKHNPEIITTVLGYYATNEELAKAGLHYSALYNVVDDAGWANLMPEMGDGGHTTTGKVRAYDPLDTSKQKYFDTVADIPDGWVRGFPYKPKRTIQGHANILKAHTGAKRSEETKQKMRAAVRKKRMTVKCAICEREITPQNMARHMLSH